MSTARRPVVEAAGGVLWRDGEHGREIALVHRPRYDDWSLPKGKRKSGEALLATAVREVTEETGYVPKVGPYLGQYRYSVTSGGRPAVKKVKYWAMQAVGGSFEANDEVDELVWLGLDQAGVRARFPIDHKVLQAYGRLPDRTSVLLIVRNGSAVRASRRVPAAERPLNRRGQEQAGALIPTLTALGIDTLLSTAARRCRDTLQPYAAANGVDVGIDEELRRTLDAGGDIALAAQRLLTLVAQGSRVAVCAEGAATNRLVAQLSAEAGVGGARRAPLRKGGWCLLHVGAGKLLSVERPDAA